MKLAHNVCINEIGKLGNKHYVTRSNHRKALYMLIMLIMFALMKSQMSSKIGTKNYVTRLNLGKPCVRFKGNIFS